MKIAIITPYFKESLDILEQCYNSVLSQEVNTDHYFIADGFPRNEINSWKVKHIILEKSHNDNGNTPRGIGSKTANQKPPLQSKELIGKESYDWLKTETGKKISKETLGFWPYDN
jgi:hypothetical protein